MKNGKIRNLFGKTFVKAGSMVLAAAVLVGSSMWYDSTRIPVPELVSYVDMENSIVVEEEAVPLVQPKVTTSTKTTRTTKKIKMKKEAKKTYSKKEATKKKTTTKKSSTSKATTTTKTVKATTVTNKFKKGSDIKTQMKTVKTTVTKTVVEKESPVQKTTAQNTSAQKNTAVKTTSSAQKNLAAGTYSVSAVAPNADNRVIRAYEQLGFKITINPNVSYSGFFSAKDQMITLKKADSTIYHELGHFVAFVAGNMDLSVDFREIYNNEKSKYTAYNKAYVLSSSSEYFAESFRNYVEDPQALKASRPQTYDAMVEALNRITDSRIEKIWSVYSVLWNR